MAAISRRIFYKYARCLIVVVLVAFFVQIFIAVYLFPSVNDTLLSKTGYVPLSQQDAGDVSARKNYGYNDDEDFPTNDKQYKPGAVLRLEELDFTPTCEIKSKEAISAIHRAKTQNCKQQIVNKTCLIQQGNFYPKELPNFCPLNKRTYGKHLGCYVDEKKMRLLSGFYGNYASTNSPEACLDICVQAGFSYAGVQYG